MKELFYMTPSKISSLKAIKVNGKEVPINSSDKAVYSFLYGLQNSNSVVNPSQEYIATFLGMSIKGVRDCTAKLETFGLLVKTPIANKNSNYCYKVIDVSTVPNDLKVYPDYSRELKSSNGKGSTLGQNLINVIRGLVGKTVSTKKTKPITKIKDAYTDNLAEAWGINQEDEDWPPF